MCKKEITNITYFIIDSFCLFKHSLIADKNINTVKLGNNELGCNKHPVITNILIRLGWSKLFLGYNEQNPVIANRTKSEKNAFKIHIFNQYSVKREIIFYKIEDRDCK